MQLDATDVFSVVFFSSTDGSENTRCYTLSVSLSSNWCPVLSDRPELQWRAQPWRDAHHGSKPKDSQHTTAPEVKRREMPAEPLKRRARWTSLATTRAVRLENGHNFNTVLHKCYYNGKCSCKERFGPLRRMRVRITDFQGRAAHLCRNGTSCRFSLLRRCCRF